MQIEKDKCCDNCKYFSKTLKSCYNVKEGMERIQYPTVHKCEKYKNTIFSG